MDLYQEIRNRLEGPVRRRVLKSPLTYRILEVLVAGQGKDQFPWQATRLMLKYALGQTAEAYEGRRPVVWHSVFFPAELLLGLGLVPFAPEVAAAVAAGVGVAPETLSRSERNWYASDGCSFHRCAIGCAEADYLPWPGAVVSSSHLCDGAPKMLEHAARQYGVEDYLLDVPHELTPAAEEYVADQLAAMAGRLARTFGTGMEQNRLARTLRYSNQAREYLIKVNDLRRLAPAPIRGDHALGFVYLMFTGFGSLEAVNVYRSLHREVSDRVRRGTGAVPGERFRLLWLHLKPYYPNTLFDLLENELGAVVAFDEMSHVYWEPLDPDRPYRSLARKVLSHHALGPMERRISAILRLVEEYGVHGVVHFSHWGCRQSTGGLQLLRDALKRKDIPFLNLDGDCVDGRNYFEGQIRTRLEGFVEMLEY